MAEMQPLTPVIPNPQPMRNNALNLSNPTPRRAVNNPMQAPALNYDLGGRPTGKHQRRAFASVLGSAQATQRTLPGLMNTLYNSSVQNAPILAQGQLDILRGFGMPFAQAQNEIDAYNQQQTSARDLEIARTTGREMTQEQLNQAKIADPEFYRGREEYTNRMLELLKQFDPSGALTEGEMANVERTQNRNNIGRGTSNSGSNTAAIANALGFDDRLMQKRDQLNSILSGFGGTLPGLRTGYNQSLTLGRDVGQNQMLGSILPTAGLNVGQNMTGGNSGLFGGTYGQSKNLQTAQYNNPNWMKGIQGASSLMSSIGSIVPG